MRQIAHNQIQQLSLEKNFQVLNVKSDFKCLIHFEKGKTRGQAGAELCQAQFKLWLAKLSYVYFKRN